MSSSHYVIDTNVLVSAALFKTSIPAACVKHVVRHGTLLFSEATGLELIAVMERPKFDALAHMNDRLEFARKILESATLVEPLERIHICRDAKDDAVLEVAVAGNAQGIITGDEDLLALAPFRNIPILTPKQFLDSVDIAP